MSGDGARPVTRANRGFGPPELAALDASELRKLCHALLLAEGVRVENYRNTVDFYEFCAIGPGIWRPQRLIVRIFLRPVEQADLDRLPGEFEMAGASEALVLTAHDLDPSLVSRHTGVHVIPPAELADRITSAALVGWDDGAPSVLAARLQLFLQLDETSAVLDPVGIRWLPALALNELPAALSDHEIEPQDLLERKTFRLLTASFRFGGERYGESARGQRLPDAVLELPGGDRTAALLDCKAASAGYRMESDHLLRFIKYWELLNPRLQDAGLTLQYLVIVSSHFPGQPGPRHPYVGRADEIGEATGLRLAYVQASDLAWTAAKIEGADVSLHERAAYDWGALFQRGLVTAEGFSEMVGGE